MLMKVKITTAAAAATAAVAAAAAAAKSSALLASSFGLLAPCLLAGLLCWLACCNTYTSMIQMRL